MTNTMNLGEQIMKSVLTVVYYGCGIFHDLLAHLQHLSHSRYGFNRSFQA